ncbi:Gfo/Idh/MocA family oxidoreductase [Suttonella sp. R2A3]|uniref:Gfo/Idh/MocA family protein n=1 Tax=Suttonella sp. R2A3 TaxID=2908648 RepID=UPI001F281AD2|nr:Gfo/Idh/MocA family oxidoreductase [Suttonella sp. R2A3]UJF25322.1 Gfo/Idh/MocA family oxidoreductase [Suttonella sp. R2A3]
MRVAVIGVGSMGRRHIQVIENLGMTLVGIFDPQPASISTAVDEFGLSDKQVFDSAEALLTDTNLDGLVVASTAPSHCEYVIQAAQAGLKYVLCEKPMAVSVDECDQMIAACRQSGTQLAVNHPQRFLEEYVSVKKLVESPALGGLRGIIISGANFGLAMNASHYFEMLRYMSNGSLTKAVQFWADTVTVPNPRGDQYKDRSGQLRAVLENGMRAYIELGGDLGHGISAIYNCKYGQVYVDELAGKLRCVHRKEESRTMPTTRYGLPFDEYLEEIKPIDVLAATQAIWQCMFEEGSFPDGDCGRNVVCALVAAQLSAEQDSVLVEVSQVKGNTRKFPWA